MRIDAVRQRPQRRLISLTPLIDVVFILLVFFMLASSFSQWRVVDLVVGGEGSAQDSRQVVTIRLTVDGPLLDGERISTERLVEQLAEWRPDTVRIDADPGVALQPALDLMVALRVIDGLAVILAGDEE